MVGKGTHKLFHAFLTITVLISYSKTQSQAKLQLVVAPEQWERGRTPNSNRCARSAWLNRVLVMLRKCWHLGTGKGGWCAPPPVLFIANPPALGFEKVLPVAQIVRQQTGGRALRRPPAWCEAQRREGRQGAGEQPCSSLRRQLALSLQSELLGFGFPRSGELQFPKLNSKPIHGMVRKEAYLIFCK